MKKRKNTFIYILLSVFVFIYFSFELWLIDITYHSIRLGTSVVKIMENDQMDTDSIQEFSKVLKKAHLEFSFLKRDLNPLFPLFKSVKENINPNTKLGLIEPFLTYGIGLTDVGLSFIDLYNQLNDDQLINYPINQKILLVLLANENKISDMQETLRLLDEARMEIEPQAIPDNLLMKYQQLDKYYLYIRNGIDLVGIVPELAGTYKKKRYLIIAQNHDELRATGGFISAVGVIEVEAGGLTHIEMKDSYSVDNFSKQYPAAPIPLEEFMLASYWVLRDANWSPDYPTSAKDIIELYELSTETNVDGVFAFDQTFIKALVSVVEPLNIEGYEDTITAENVETYMHYSWSPEPEEGISEEWWLNRKSFIGDLGNAMISNIYALDDNSSMQELLRHIFNNMQEGHLLLYFKNAEAQAAIHGMGIDGSVSVQPDQDFLFLIDSNIGFNKVDRVIRRELEYFIDFSNIQQPYGIVNAHYYHPIQDYVPCVHQAVYGKNYDDMTIRCYWNYWRVYTLNDTELIGANYELVPGSFMLNGEDWQQLTVDYEFTDFVSYEGLMVLPTGLDQGFSINYLLPERIIQQNNRNDDFHYELLVKKQAGLDGLGFQLQVKIPDQSTLKPLEKTGWKYDDISGVWVWIGTLTEDKEFYLDIESK